ncbi:hypothetical protein ACI65C_006257 [Semiaphis heraclei]
MKMVPSRARRPFKRHSHHRRSHKTTSRVRYPWLRLANRFSQNLERIISNNPFITIEFDNVWEVKEPAMEDAASSIDDTAPSIDDAAPSIEDAPLPTAEEILAETVESQSVEIILATEYGIDFGFDDFNLDSL